MEYFKRSFRARDTKKQAHLIILREEAKEKKTVLTGQQMLYSWGRTLGNLHLCYKRIEL